MIKLLDFLKVGQGAWVVTAALPHPNVTVVNSDHKRQLIVRLRLQKNNIVHSQHSVTSRILTQSDDELYTCNVACSKGLILENKIKICPK